MGGGEHRRNEHAEAQNRLSPITFLQTEEAPAVSPPTLTRPHQGGGNALMIREYHSFRARGRDPRRRRGRVRWVPAGAQESRTRTSPNPLRPQGRRGACGLSSMTMCLRSRTLIDATRY